MKSGLFVILSMGLLCLMFGYSDGDGGEAQSSSQPVVIGCNTVQQGTCTFSNIGCQVGVASFDVNLSQTGPAGTNCSARFHVTCAANGCVASVTLR